MNQDDELNLDQKLKLPQRENKTNVEFIKSLGERSYGYDRRNNLCTIYNLQACAEDELVKKQFKEMRCEMPGLPRSTFLMVFSPDGTKVASTHGNHHIYVTDVRTGKHIKTLVGHPRTPWCIAFHPTSNQIIASGCLGGQVRIWDLSGGSEVWTTESQTVIASIAFHPDERLLVIATYNELFFWDWSKPEPFMHVATGSAKEKVRYVAFDKLGHKLITGITNSPQTRWERVRAPVPVPRPADRATSPYRRRITPRLITNLPVSQAQNNLQCTSRPSTSREPLSSVPERERRITTCYRDLVQQYEVLVHRYLQIYRPPVMIDQGTDPMELDQNIENSPVATTSNAEIQSATPTGSGRESPVPSTSGTQTLKKSSASKPAKNKSKKSIPYVPSSSSRSSQGNANNSSQASPQVPANILFPLKSSTSVSSTQTTNQQPAIVTFDPITASLSSTSQIISPNAPSTSRSNKNVDFRIRIQRNDDDSSSDEERLLQEIIEDIENRNQSETTNENPSPASQTTNTEEQEQTRESAVYRYLNLARRGDTEVTREHLSPNVTRLTMTRRLVLPTTTTFVSSPNNSTPQDTTPKTTNRRLLLIPQTTSVQTPTPRAVQEPTYKMRIKYSMIPKSNDANASQTQESSPSTSTGTTPNASTQTNDNISDLIRNAEIMLAKFRENLEQRGHLSGIDLPSTSASLPSQSPGQNKPSKGTNTNDSNQPSVPRDTGRKRIYPGFLKKTKMGIVFNSSSDSSSDDEQKTKKVRPLKQSKATTNNEHTYAAKLEDKVSQPGTSSDHSYAGVSNLANEHSYAGQAESSNSNADGTVRIKINLSSVRDEVATPETTETTASQPTNTSSRPFNFNAELELLVTDLLANRDSNENSPTSNDNEQNSEETASNNRVCRTCGTCGGTIENRSRSSDNNDSTSTTNSSCARTNICSRSLINTSTSTTNSPTYTYSSDPPRRRFLSHRLSAFHPTRLSNQRPTSHTVRSPNFLQPLLRSRLGNLNSSESPPRSQSFAADEVINYSERVNEEETPRSYHPFDPPPELMSINPENIGIGNMYSNIVQELESSLNDVRNIRANRRLGETSDMLSSFSERLESIMTQSNAIMRNLSSSLDSLPTNETEGLFRSNSDDPLYDAIYSPSDIRRNLFTSSNPITSDHTYPLNPENPQTSNMSPLMLSLHLTVSHIQRQARLLRQQVESIERIDRAMLEVAQLQMMRQMFDELHRHFSSITGNDNRTGVSSMRQMMAGTRISDSSPYDSPSDDNISQNHTPEPEPQASTSTSSQDNQTTTSRSRTRKTYPRCLFLMHRQFRRSNNMSLGSRRNSACSRDRVLRRNIYRRFVPSRQNSRPTIDVSTNRGRGYLNIFNPDTLPSMTKRLEHFLMEHGRYIGRSMIPTTSSLNTRSDVGEHIMMLRLSNCRQRINRILGINDDTRNEYTSVTIDGSSRFGARQTLSSILDTLSRFMEVNSSSLISSYFRSHIWEVIELSLLLSEILLLQIVDSIPPPSGMNLDPERESLSLRIDQMCSRMLQSRSSGQSHQLTRSLRLLRLTVRHATHALGQTYTARRNAMLPTNSDNERLDSRQGLLVDIHNCLRNIRRHRQSSTRVDNVSNPTGREWYRTINDLITRYTNSPSQEGNSVLNNETGEETRTPTVEDANSSDDNASSSNTSSIRERVQRPLYRTSNVNLLNNEESSPSGPRNRLWNVPTVTVNDVPISEPVPSPWHPRFVANRQRLNERLDELRTTGGLFRPRFLHPLYAGISPFDSEFDDPHSDRLYDSDIIATVTPNHRIQVWEFSQGTIPNISNASKNVVVTECKIHNDASVDYASDGSILVTLLPSGGYMNVTNRLGVYSLEWETLGQCLYQTSFEQNAVSVSLSPINRHLVVGLASRRVPIISDKWTMAQIFLLDDKEAPYGKLSPIRELEQNRDTSYMSVNCIRWLPSSGQGLVFATNTGHLRFLT